MGFDSGVPAWSRQLSLELRWVRDQLDFARSETTRGLKERDEREHDLQERTREADWLKTELAARDEQLEAQTEQEEAQDVLNEEKRWLREQLKFSRDETKRARRALDERERVLHAAGQLQHGPLLLLLRGGARARWRRGGMQDLGGNTGAAAHR